MVQMSFAILALTYIFCTTPIEAVTLKTDLIYCFILDCTSPVLEIIDMTFTLTILAKNIQHPKIRE